MKILVISQYYYPEPFRITDICEELVKQGHEVTVITGIPNYPMGRIYDGYGKGQKRFEEIGGVKVRRCFTIGRRSGAIWRFLNYYSFALSSELFAARIHEEFDVVFVNQLSPVMMANAGVRYKKKHGKKLVLYCLDLWPASLAVGGIGEGSLVYRYFHRISDRIYKQADKLLITSKSFAHYFEDVFGIKETEYLPQYAEELFSAEKCQKAPGETIDLMFAGNVGTAQSVDTILRAACLTQDVENLYWHIVGDGSELENCKLLAKKLFLKNVVFHGRKPLEEMPAYYSMADAMLVTMNEDKIAQLTLPGKVQTYMMAAKPILCSADGEVPAIITEAGCGYCSGATDAEALAASARRFCELSPEQRAELGTNAKKYGMANFGKQQFYQRLFSSFQ